MLPFSLLLTIPRHVSQQKTAGVNKVGAGPRREISIKPKNGAEGEGEYGDLKGMGFSLPRGLRRGARGKRRGGLCGLGGRTTGNDSIIRKSILTGNNYSMGKIAKRQQARHC